MGYQAAVNLQLIVITYYMYIVKVLHLKKYCRVKMSCEVGSYSAYSHRTISKNSLSVLYSLLLPIPSPGMLPFSI
jgi:hypothetical protein